MFRFGPRFRLNERRSAIQCPRVIVLVLHGAAARLSEFLMWYPGNGRVSMAITDLAVETADSQGPRFVPSFSSSLGSLQCNFHRNGAMPSDCGEKRKEGEKESKL
ncbi:hypothetical protein EYF80_017215 [Liparis tanakae]|uniref:Uncharacterized protein n=1 Tax=Liparis tanakae TaxID=230148 RepID=A0A4Z2I3T9_9TELE|nr:hypothetical protein EYF80_017215 [Liparis tanakae]